MPLEVLVVGAGPAGLTCALALASNGCEDITIVDAHNTGLNVSRAIVIHAQTIEELDSIGYAKSFTERGLHANYMFVYAQQTRLLRANFKSLAGQTKFPYALLISQAQTERILEDLVGIAQSDNGIRATLEFGQTIDARYVVGADGARSTIRALAGIEFRDPTTNEDPYAEAVQPGERNGGDNAIFLGPLGFLLLVPLPREENDGSEKVVYRISCPADPSAKEVTKEHLQKVLNAGTGLALEDTPVINTILSSSRFRIRSALGGQFSRPFGGGNVALVGDAAHVHSPVGGQGMNLGIRDAIALGKVLHEVIVNNKRNASTYTAEREHAAERLEAYSNQRKRLAIRVIRMTKVMIWLTGLESPYGRWLRDIVWWIIGKPAIANNMFAWRLSGLQLKADP